MTTGEIVFLIVGNYFSLLFMVWFAGSFRDFKKEEHIKKIEKIRRNAY